MATERVTEKASINCDSTVQILQIVFCTNNKKAIAFGDGFDDFKCDYIKRPA
jgi:hypothetical protein